MQPLLSALPVFSVTTIFYAWNVYRHTMFQQRQRQLCQRVAYMLWVAAERAA